MTPDGISFHLTSEALVSISHELGHRTDPEIAVRLSLGANRFRIIRQLLTESLLIAAVAGELGFLLSIYLMHLLSQLHMPFPIPITYDRNVDWRALVFTLVVTVLTGLMFGLAPALQALRIDLSPALNVSVRATHLFDRSSSVFKWDG